MIELSIIIINKDYLGYLKKCVESCLNQKTNYNYEIIVVDDGSTDGSIDYIKSINDKKLKFLKSHNKGIEKASNKGFKYSKGKFIARVDSDDSLCSQFIQKSVDEIKKLNVAFVYSNYYQINSSDKIIKKKYLPVFKKKEIIRRGDFLATGTVYRKKFIKYYGYYNEKIKNCGLENYELILKLLNHNLKGKKINSFLFYNRHHKKNISVIKNKKINDYGRKLFIKMKLGQYSKNNYHPWI